MRRWQSLAPSTPHGRARGFSLPELVIVIVITGIVAGVLVNVLSGPAIARQAIARRAALTDQADQALRRVGFDLRRALGYSIRTDAGNTAIAMLNVADAGRYRTGNGGGHSGAAHLLNIGGNDSSFDLIGRFQATTGVAGGRLVIFHTGATGSNAWANTNVITPTTTTVTVSNDAGMDRISLSANFNFNFGSSNQRIYLVDTAVGYRCVGDELLRYSFGTWDNSLPPANFGTGTVVTDDVTACSFTYYAGTSQQAPMVIVRLVLTRDGESVTLLHQIPIGNPP